MPTRAARCPPAEWPVTTTPVHGVAAIVVWIICAMLGHRLRIAARRLGIARIDASDAAIQLQFDLQADLDPVKLALIMEWARPLPSDPATLAERLKSQRLGTDLLS